MLKYCSKGTCFAARSQQNQQPSSQKPGTPGFVRFPWIGAPGQTDQVTSRVPQPRDRVLTTRKRGDHASRCSDRTFPIDWPALRYTRAVQLALAFTGVYPCIVHTAPSNLGQREREGRAGKTISLGYIDRGCTTVSGSRGTNSPLGFLRGVGDRLFPSGDRATIATTFYSLAPLGYRATSTPELQSSFSREDKIVVDWDLIRYSRVHRGKEAGRGCNGEKASMYAKGSIVVSPWKLWEE